MDAGRKKSLNFAKFPSSNSSDDGEPGDESLLDETVVSKTKYPSTKHFKVKGLSVLSNTQSTVAFTNPHVSSSTLY